MKIIYSRLGEKADSVIKRIISSERREWIVVSSDREIASHAWSTDSIPIPSETFLPFMESGGAGSSSFPGVSDYEDGKDEDDEGPGDYRKGGARRLSKKEKALRRALNKL